MTLPRSAARRAFTLIELLVVIGIIAILIGIAIAVGAKVQESGKVKATKDVLAALDASLTALMSKNAGQMPAPFVADPRLTAVNPRPGAWQTMYYIPVADVRGEFEGTPPSAPLDPKPIINSVALFMAQADAAPEASSILKSIPTKFVRRWDPDAPDTATLAAPNTPTETDLAYQPNLPTVFDAWNRPIRYVHPAWDGVWADSPTAATQSLANFRDVAGSGMVNELPPSSQGNQHQWLFKKVRRTNVAAGGFPADSDGGTCPTGRPYFYSCGPDGDPSTTADNIYTTIPKFPNAR